MARKKHALGVSSPSPRLRGEGRGEGQVPPTLAPNVFGKAPHPDRFPIRPLPASEAKWSTPQATCYRPLISRERLRDSKPYVIKASVSLDKDTVGRAQNPWAAEEAAAPRDSGPTRASRYPSATISRRVLIIRVQAVFYPFPSVTKHVGEPEWIPRESVNRSRLFAVPSAATTFAD